MSALVRARSDGRHLPSSHPVLARARFQAALARAIDANGAEFDPIAATVVADQSARIEHLAHAVAQLPDTPLTGQQRRSLQLIARELYRRATT